MWAPDPCQTQMKELAELQEVEKQLAQTASPPTASVPAAAPQLSDTYDLADLMDPAIPETEFQPADPSLNNMWSPNSIENIMQEIWEEMEARGGGSDEEMETLLHNITVFLHWVPERGCKRRTKLKYNPNNKRWIGIWVP
nr:MAG: nonstructural protein 2 [Protoparvovirus sp.]